MSVRFMLNETSYFGKGAREELAPEIKNRGFKKAFVVTDKSLAECGVINKVTDVLEKAGIPFEVYSEVKPNPTIKNVTDGIEACKKSGADVIVAVGGGSSIDTSKGISIVMTNPDRADIVSLNGASNTVNRGMPVIALPTTSGTAAEVTINYVITDEERKIKMVCVDPHDIPIMAIVDSDLMATMPKSLASATGMDALTHAIEAYVAGLHSPFSDPLAIHAIEMIFDNLKASYEGDMQARGNMHIAQCLAGMAFSNALLGIVHSLAHKTGAVFDTGHIPHGCANAIYLPYVIQYNAKVCEDRFAMIARKLGLPGVTDKALTLSLIKAVEDLRTSLHIVSNLKEFGVKEDEFLEKKHMIAERAVGDACTGSNPRETSVEDMEKILECIYYGKDVTF